MRTHLPLAPPASPHRDVLPPALSAEFMPARILVVDDQPANIQLLGAVLGKLGHEIIPASDGPTALKRVALRTPDLILLDLLMPGMGGCEVCLQLKDNPAWKDIPVIFLSAADDKDLIVRALDSGGVDYITKPFNQAELLSRVRTQLALKSTQDKLKKLAEDKDELMGILTHDLKSYLGGMNMSAGLLCERIRRLNDERLGQLSENIFRSSSLALAFVREFLANAAADHAFTMRMNSINLVDVVANTVRQHEEAARSKKLEIRLDLPDAPLKAFADATALAQVLDNLVSNALKFSPPGRTVFVSVSVAGRFAQCVVRDEGPGFTADDRTRMFRRYVRLSARPTGGEPSTGLGLSIVYKLVQGMRGELTCDSVSGQGATFTIRLAQTE
jgi:two-component system sensor histidine kinase/response regulator